MAGQKHRNQGEQGRAQEKRGAHRHHIGHPVQAGDDHRGELPADEPPGGQSQGDAQGGEGQGLVPDDPLQLPPGGADSLQQAVKPDVPGHRDLEHVVDNEVTGEENQQEHSHDNRRRGRVHAVGQLGPGVAPVDPGIDVVLPRRLALVAVVG